MNSLGTKAQMICDETLALLMSIVKCPDLGVLEVIYPTSFTITKFVVHFFSNRQARGTRTCYPCSAIYIFK
jgi:hypothetical protein